MKVFFEINQPLLEKLYPSYSNNAKLLVSKISDDRKLSRFDRFNKRFKISWGIEIEFTDDLRIIKEDTRACYRLMLKLSDLWFSFEHLVRTAADAIPNDMNTKSKSKVNFYQQRTQEELGFNKITDNFNQILTSKILHEKGWKQEINQLFAYLVSRTTGETKRIIADAILQIDQKKEFQAKHIFALAYGIRNIYVHEGVAAALGGKNYEVKKTLYQALYDTLILYSLALGNAYCCKRLIQYSIKPYYQ